MEGVDESTDLWRHPQAKNYYEQLFLDFEEIDFESEVGLAIPEGSDDLQSTIKTYLP